MSAQPSEPAVLDEAELARIMAMNSEGQAEYLAGTRARLGMSLPPKCLDEVGAETRHHRTAYRIVIGEAALAALGQTAQSLCRQLDKLHFDHNFLLRRVSELGQLTDGADSKSRLGRAISRRSREHSERYRFAAELTLGRLLGLRSVLHVQLKRESYERTGMSVPVEWRLPIVVVSPPPPPPPPPELELVAIHPPPAGPDSFGGAVAAADADASTDTTIGTSTVKGTGRSADKGKGGGGDGLDFLD
jgi:hypothetical protein